MPLSLFCDLVDLQIRGLLVGDDPDIKKARADYERDTSRQPRPIRARTRPVVETGAEADDQED